ncbi:MAG: LuxR C-terminal-related transcriptional regulator [Lutibacter sp.]|nr:LuxR C-terminal-related transcriptional regulator [Lutibacter sp.]
MNEKDSAKVFSVWDTENKILQPNKKELLLEIVDQVASSFAAGSFYYFVLNFENIGMDYVSDGVKDVLSIAREEFSMKKAFELMHPEDLAKMNEKEAIVFDFFLKKLSVEDMFLYKSVYIMRLKHTNGSYKTILHQAQVLSASDDGKIQKTLCIHTDITYLNIPINHKLSFISTKRPSYYYSYESGSYALENESILKLEKDCFKDIFSKREKEIVKLMAKGIKFNEIAKLLFVSPHTINAHKKNILRKSGCKNTPELIARCYVEGLI